MDVAINLPLHEGYRLWAEFVAYFLFVSPWQCHKHRAVEWNWEQLAKTFLLVEQEALVHHLNHVRSVGHYVTYYNQTDWSYDHVEAVSGNCIVSMYVVEYSRSWRIQRNQWFLGRQCRKEFMRSNDFDIRGSIIVRGLYLREVKNFYSCGEISKVCWHYE